MGIVIRDGVYVCAVIFFMALIGTPTILFVAAVVQHLNLFVSHTICMDIFRKISRGEQATQQEATER